ncbi:unnamed protein product [Darwinula stevensoni]|uniref:CG-1 domain-containing protein n=1 Tax=Darwinula stevensoni TaxID=69355 RepID=A0A7R8X6L0_9CRUS|nr:unnamed protein product [Darwinula stevensoni]CAG0879570.1 unnamed protein product [Darwinula stevensoni]
MKEIASILISFDRHKEWLAKDVTIRPPSGSMFLYDRKRSKYRRDGYSWKKRRDGKTIREDHMKLKVQGVENPDVVLVHYLNVIPTSNEDVEVSVKLPSKDWNQQDLLLQLRPMFSLDNKDGESVPGLEAEGNKALEMIVQQLLGRGTRDRLDKSRYGGSQKQEGSRNGGKSRDPCLPLPQDPFPTLFPDLNLGHQEHVMVSITDFAPQTAPCQSILRGIVCFEQGGTKMLLMLDCDLNPLSSVETRYQVDFDGLIVPAVYVQPQVLSCTIPSHAPGKALFHVSLNGTPLSSPQTMTFTQAPGPVAADLLQRLQSLSLSLNHTDNMFIHILVLRFAIDEVLSTYKKKEVCDLALNKEDWYQVQELCNIGEELIDNLGYANAPPPKVMKSEGLLKLLCHMKVSNKNKQTIINNVEPRDIWEESLVSYARHLIPGQWNPSTSACTADAPRSTILHAAASLGYARLICVLLHWKVENSSTLLEREVDTQSRDLRGFSPLMCACEKGHMEAALVLYQWDRRSVDLRDNEGRSAPDIALANGFANIGKEIQRLESTFAMELRDIPRRLIKRASTDSGLDMTHQRRSSSFSTPNGFGIDSFQPYCSHGVNGATPEANLCGCQYMSSVMKNLKPSSVLWTDKEGLLSFVAEGIQENHGTCREVQFLTLAEQIIAALPARIKQNDENSMEEDHSASPLHLDVSCDTCYRHHTGEGVETGGTPCSSLSPASSSLCIPSPSSSCTPNPTQASAPTTADFTEFFAASEQDLAKLTLSDEEQRELYEAAVRIQKAYRSYKGRRKQQQEEQEAALVIQNYYRRYKQYAYMKEMGWAASLIQTSYCPYPTDGKQSGSREGTPSSSHLKRTFSQRRREHQAARKIQQFMRQSTSKLAQERAQAVEVHASTSLHLHYTRKVEMQKTREKREGRWLNACEELEEEEDNLFVLTRIVEIGLIGSA